jgi:predicted phage-related endonuclease
MMMMFNKRKKMFSLMLENTDGICTSLLQANANYRQTIIAQIVKVD